MRKDLGLGKVAGPAALALGIAVGAGLALFLTGAFSRRHGNRALGRSGEGGEETSYREAVDTAMDESFPASDPPSYSAPRRMGRPKNPNH